MVLHASSPATASRVGNTPLVPVAMFVDDQPREVWLKLESANPWGSIKDRTALSLIEDLERRGLRAGDRVVESTSGNLGAALAAVCRERGYEFVAVVDPRTTSANLDAMADCAARIECVSTPDPHGGYLLTRLERVRQLASQPGWHWPNQYSNDANPRAHLSWTGPELVRQAPDAIDAVFIAVSTGGTLAGIAECLRRVSPHTHVEAVDVNGSVVFSAKAGRRRLVGIGSSRKSEFLRPWSYDSHSLVADAEAVAHCRALEQATGVGVGGSSGAVLAACCRYLRHHPECELPVCLCPDGSGKYRDSIYDDEWVERQELVDDLERLDRSVAYAESAAAIALP